MRSDVVKFKTLDGATTYDSVTDWGMTLTHCDEQKPAPKFNRIDVPGTNGSVDVSAALSGDIPFEDRTVELTFFKLCTDHDAAYALAGDVAAAVHGKQMQLQTPDARTDGDTWYTGDVEITECRFEDRGCEIDVRAVCSPFRYSETGGRLEISDFSGGTVIGASNLLKISDSTLNGNLRYLQVSFDGSSTLAYRNQYHNRVAVQYANSSNMFDMDYAYLTGKTINATAQSPAWVNSSQISQDGQICNFGAVNVNWVERLIVCATNESSIADTDGFRVFPFTENTRARVWVYSDDVTAVSSSVTVDGVTYSAGIKVDYTKLVGNGSSVGSNGVYTGTTGSLGTIQAPAVGSAWNGEYLDFAVDPYLGQLRFTLAGVTCPHVHLLIAFYYATDTAPETWTEPDTQVCYFELPQPLRRFNEIDSGMNYGSDVLYDEIASAYTDTWDGSAYVKYDVQKPEEPVHASFIAASGATASGILTRRFVPLGVYAGFAGIHDYTVDAGDQPAYPTVTTDRLDMYIEYNGNSYKVPRYTTVTLDSLLSRGENTISATAGYGGYRPTNIITWPIGVL